MQTVSHFNKPPRILSFGVSEENESRLMLKPAEFKISQSSWL